MANKNQIMCLAGQLFFCVVCFGQTNKIDSLRKVLPKLTDTSRIECLNALGVEFRQYSDEDSTIYYANAVYKESQKINFAHGLAKACMLKAAAAGHFHNDNAEMEKMARQSLSWFDKSSNKQNINVAFWQLSKALCKEAEYDEALTNAKLCYDCSQKAHDETWTAAALEAMTDIYRETGDYDKLFAVQYEMIKDERRSGDANEYTIHELWVMGLVYLLLEEYPTALTFWRRLFAEGGGPDALARWDTWNLTEYAQLLTLSNLPDSALLYYNAFDSAKADIRDLRYFLVSKGEYYFFRKQYSPALANFLKGLAYHQEVSDFTQVKRTLLDIAKTYAALQMNDSAIIYARQGLAIALKAKSRPAIRDVYKILSTAFDQLRKSDSANFYFRQYVTSRDSVLNDQTRARFATYTFQQRITSLNKEKSLQQQQLQRARMNRNILIAALIVGLLLAGLIVRSIRLKRRKDQLQHLMTEANAQLESRRKEQQLAEMRQQQTELEMQALRAQMNPHFIFNSLNSINMFILENNKLRASEYLSKFSRLVRLILQNSQEALIPLEKELEALQLYLELESLRFENKFDYKITIANNVDITVLKVPPLIIQPYAENAIWHGLMHLPQQQPDKKQAGHLEIELHRVKDVLVCKIIDDGIGREKSAEIRNKSGTRHRSMGIKMTGNRMAMMQINNATNPVEIKDLVYPDGTAAGTEVILKMPIKIN